MNPVSVSVSVNGNTVECETEANHLRHRFSSQDSDTLVKYAIHSFWRGLICLLLNLVTHMVLSNVNYSNNIAFWVLNGKSVKALCVSWRKALRMLWKVHPITNNDIIVTMSKMLPLEIQLNPRFANFYNKCKLHESQLMQMIIVVASSNLISPVARIR